MKYLKENPEVLKRFLERQKSASSPLGKKESFISRPAQDVPTIQPSLHEPQRFSSQPPQKPQLSQDDIARLVSDRIAWIMSVVKSSDIRNPPDDKAPGGEVPSQSRYEQTTMQPQDGGQETSEVPDQSQVQSPPVVETPAAEGAKTPAAEGAKTPAAEDDETSPAEGETPPAKDDETPPAKDDETSPAKDDETSPAKDDETSPAEGETPPAKDDETPAAKDDETSPAEGETPPAKDDETPAAEGETPPAKDDETPAAEDAETQRSHESQQPAESQPTLSPEIIKLINENQESLREFLQKKNSSPLDKNDQEGSKVDPSYSTQRQDSPLSQDAVQPSQLSLNAQLAQLSAQLQLLLSYMTAPLTLPSDVSNPPDEKTPEVEYHSQSRYEQTNDAGELNGGDKLPEGWAEEEQDDELYTLPSDEETPPVEGVETPAVEGVEVEALLEEYEEEYSNMDPNARDDVLLLFAVGLIVIAIGIGIYQYSEEKKYQVMYSHSTYSYMYNKEIILFLH